MITDVIFTTIFSLVIAVSALSINAISNNPYKLTLRGRRTLFIIALIVGAVIAQPVMHLYWDCDLRAGATTQCKIGWI